MTRKGTQKLEEFLDIEKEIQAIWNVEKSFNTDAKEIEGKNKYLATFPYPYMNGRLHLGHAFSLTKCEFAVSYQFLKGKHCSWPFGFHCTGTPIVASAQKIKREIELYGNPPVFPVHVEQAAESSVKEEINFDKSKSKKSKAAAKSGGKKYQWEIMQSLGLKDEEIAAFADPSHWLRYFPDLCMSDLKRFGVKADFRRSFITTDENPYYDSFVRWQFIRLKEKGLIKFGKRNTIFSPRDNQPCMDHERSVGEGVCPQEYTLIKLRLLSDRPDKLKCHKEPIFFVAATLRPETMYGQTNCWLHPDIEYEAVKSKVHNCIFICTHRSALNMAYQSILDDEKQGAVDVICTLKGSELLGSKLSGPLCEKYKEIYALPMMSISSNKGTGIVTSVPSDSPDDFTALRDLKNKKALCDKYGIKEFMIEPFEPVEIIETPNFGRLPAKKVVEDMKIQSQNDKDKLIEAKNLVYKSGFYEGVLICGPHKGSKIQDVKKLIQDQLIRDKLALIYYEPEKEVISRSGDVAVVALCDQWFLEYSSPEWKLITQKAIDQLKLTDETRKNLEAALDWFQDHACSRTFGLGTKLPWDSNWIIESLSDSTIHMAYYTVAHLLQGPDNLDGMTVGPIGITPEDTSPEMWDYLFLGVGSVEEISKTCPSVTQEKMDRLRHEFEYWYGVDLRVSGKDLIPNHLTYYLYNHVAMWPNDPQGKWPREIRANGHLLLNSEKMSKQTGNFLTLSEGIEKYSADGIRLALADAGDTLEDANLEESMCEAGFLRLYNLYSWIKTTVEDLNAKSGEFRSGIMNLHADRVFENEINKTIELADKCYAEFNFKEIIKYVFYELQSARDRYILVCQSVKASLHADLIRRYIHVQLVLLSPICPHVTLFLWKNSLKEEKSIHFANWPKLTKPVDSGLSEEATYLDDIIHKFRLLLKSFGQKKGGKKGDQGLKSSEADKKPNYGRIWVAASYPTWQATIIKCMKDNLNSDGSLPNNAVMSNALKPLLKAMKPMHAKKAMPFVQLIKERYEAGDRVIIDGKLNLDEERVFTENLLYVQTSLGLEGVRIATSDESSDETIANEVCPKEPIINYSHEEKVPKFLTVQVKCADVKAYGLFTLPKVIVYEQDSVRVLIKRIIKESSGLEVSKLDVTKLVLKAFKEDYGSRKMPPYKEDDLIELQDEDVFVIDPACSSLKINLTKKASSINLVERCLIYTTN